MIAATGQGICAIQFADSDQECRRALCASSLSPLAAETTKPCPSIERISSASSQDDRPIPSFPSTFARPHFNAASGKPCKNSRGETRSYSAVARKIGMPKATRAVARACATNPVAVAIPCHRVVRQDGGLGGYRWGIERKKQLLAMEKEAGV